MKLQYHKLNNCFFLIGVLLSALFTLFNLAVLDIEYKSVFCIFFAVSFVGCASCFYHRNVGLIALLCGSFGKSSEDIKYVDYSKYSVEDVERLKEITDFGKGSMLFYKINTREVYQIIKCSDKLFLNKCTSDNELITDFSNTDKIKVGKGDRQIHYSEIKNITYSYSAFNYYLPIINIVTAKKHFRFIGFLEELDSDEVKTFFSDIPKIKIKIRNFNNSGKSLQEKIELDKRIFYFNVFSLISCLTLPYAMFLQFIDEKARGLIVAYTLVNIIMLIIFLLLPIVDSKHYVLFRDEETKSNKKKNVTRGIIISYLIFLIVVFNETYLNLWWLIVLVAILSIGFIISYFKNNSVARLSAKEKAGKILGAILIYALLSFVIVSCVNNMAVIEQSEQEYYILQKSYSYSQKTGAHYTAKINLDGDEHRLYISRDTYESNNDMVNVKKVKGILGVEYIIEN